MLYSESSSHLILAFEKRVLQQPTENVVESVRANLVANRVIDLSDTSRKLEFDYLFHDLADRSPNCTGGGEEGTSDNSTRSINLVQDDTYYLDMATFEVEETYFHVPEYQFINLSSRVNSNLNAGPWGGTSKMKLCTPANPFQLPQVCIADFRGILEYMYPLDPNHVMTTSEWISSLRLSTAWRMHSIRQRAIVELNQVLDTVSKVQLGYNCKVTQWVRQGCIDLVTDNRKHLTRLEVEKVGVGIAARLCKLKEQRYKQEWDIYLDRFTLDGLGTRNLISNCLSGDQGDLEVKACTGDDAVKDILEARTMGVQKLLKEACERLVIRRSSLTANEAGELGLTTAVKIWEARLETRRAACKLVQDLGISPACTNAKLIAQAVCDAFEQDLVHLGVEECTSGFGVSIFWRGVRHPDFSGNSSWGTPANETTKAASVKKGKKNKIAKKETAAEIVGGFF